MNELHCSAKPVYGYEVLNFLTFLPGPCPSPTPPAQGEWGRSGHASCLFAQSHSPQDYWFLSRALREAIHTTQDRLGLLSDIIDRYGANAPPFLLTKNWFHFI